MQQPSLRLISAALLAITSLCMSGSAGAQNNAPGNVTTTLDTSLSGYYFGTECALGGTGFCAYNDYGYGNEGAVATSGTFQFTGGSFIGSTINGNYTAPSAIHFVGSDGTNTYTSANCALSTSAFTVCNFFGTANANYTGVNLTSLVIVPTGGTAYQGASGGYFVTDQLTFNSPIQSQTTTTPEPSSIALLGTGFVGMIPLLRRRRRA